MRKQWVNTVLLIALIIASAMIVVSCSLSADEPKPVGAHEHVFSKNWSYDNQYHWYAAVCGCRPEVTSSKSEHDIQGGVCSICDFDISSKVFGNLVISVDGIIKPINRDIINGIVIIPSEIEGITVTSIGEDAFYGCTGLTSITIPDSVTSIGREAFRGCTGLTSITISDSVTHIGDYAFYGCIGLRSITIPDSVTSIESAAFYDCRGLTSITIPDSVTSIGWKAFSGCTGLTSITIPDSVTSIESRAFEGCTGLTSITIPDSVTHIGDYAFFGCSAQISITIPDMSIGSYAFSGCTGQVSITIPDSVTSIGSYAFEGCTWLTSITIPDSITSIGYRAFSGCTGLTSVTIPDSLEMVSYIYESWIFHGCKKLGIVKANSTLWAWPSATGSVIIPEDIKRIGPEAFYGCTGLTSITIPDSVTSIMNYAFKYTGLTTITIPDSVTSIGFYAFEDCISLSIIRYEGTCSQWASVSKGSGWANGCATNVVVCADGTVSI